MHRLGRLATLVILLALVVWGSTTALPGLVDASEGDDFRPDCEYTYLVFEVTDPTDDERASAIAYENLSDARWTAFDTYLDTGDGAAELDVALWNRLYERPEPIHYVAYDGTFYRAKPLLQECSSWERYGNGTIP